MTLPESNAASAPPSDRSSLHAFQRSRDFAHLRPILNRYAGLVHASALRRTGSPGLAVEITRAVFLVFARRARRLSKKIVLADWLSEVTRLACRKRVGRPQPSGFFGWFRRSRPRPVPSEASLWAQLAPALDAAIERLPVAQRRAFLVRVLQGQDLRGTAEVLGVRERTVEKRVTKGLDRLVRHFRRAGISIESATLAEVCRAEGRLPAVPDTLMDEWFAAITGTRGRRPADAFARRVLNTLAWTRWRRRVVIGVPTVAMIFLLLVVGVWIFESRDGHSRLISMFLVHSVKQEGRSIPGLAAPARSWPGKTSVTLPSAHGVRSARDLYQTTNIWPVHLSFAAEQWEAMEPKRITPLPHFMQPDGTVLLRNPEAQRSGLAGVLGFDFDWAHADVEFGGMRFTNAAARIKGNGTFLGSLHGGKRSWKIDLNKFTKGRRLGGADELTLNNMVNDYSSMSDALAYEFFREAGVPASRTAYAYVSVSVEGKWSEKPLGLYVLVEPVNADFALEQFGSRRVPVFKPVTYELFQHLGDDWPAYADIYDLKTKATPAQLQRVVEFARLVTHADDEAFAQRLAEFLDIGKFARYLACEVLLSNYDSFLSNGQNFYLYLDPDSNRFGFIPWDLDLSWGGFFLLGTTEEREQASIWRPWVGRNRFLERVFRVKTFRDAYRARLEELLARQFVPDRLHRRVDELAAVVRGPVAAESDFRYGKFLEATGGKRRAGPADEENHGANRPAHQLKRFIDARAKSVRDQLDGKSRGIVLERNRRR